jgi:hypothetical protein
MASKTITLRRGETVQTEWVDFSAGDPGVHNLTFLLDPVEDEQILGNNSVSRVLDVPRGRRSVVYVEGEPRWEYKFIRRANDGDGSVRLVSMLRTTPNKFYRQGVDDADELVKGFPDKAEDLFAYDALECHHPAGGFNSQLPPANAQRPDPGMEPAAGRAGGEGKMTA